LQLQATKVIRSKLVKANNLITLVKIASKPLKPYYLIVSELCIILNKREGILDSQSHWLAARRSWLTASLKNKITLCEIFGL